MASIADLDFRVNVRDTASRALFRVGDGFRNAGDRVGDFSRRLENAAGRSTRTSRTISRVSDALTRMGRRAVDANIRLRNTSRNADDSSNAFTRMGASAAKAGAKITGGLSALGAKMGVSNPYVAGALAISAAILGIYAAAVATGAILAGLGAGFIALGLKGQKSSVAVQKAMTALGDTTKDVLKRASSSLAGDFVDAFGKLRNTVLGTEADLTRMFDTIHSSGAIDALASGVDGFAKNVMPGLNKAMDAAAPLLAEVGKALPGLGASVGKFFDSLGKSGPGATKALVSFIDIVGSQIELLGNILWAASSAWDQFTNKLELAAKPFRPIIDDLGTLKAAVFGVVPANGALAVSIAATANAANREAVALGKVSAELVKMGALTLDSREVERQFQAAIDDATGALKDNGRTLDANTAKGRANAEALDAIARATHAKHDAATKAKWSEAALTATLQTGADATFRQALAFNMSRQKALDYTKSVIGIPPSRATVIDLSNLAKSRADVAGWKNLLAQIPAVKSTYLNVYESVIRQDAARFSNQRGLARANGGPVGFANGGFNGRVLGAGTSKSDSIPAYLSNGEYVIRASSVAKAGVSTLDAINKTGRVPAASVSATPSPTVTNYITIHTGADPQGVVNALKQYARDNGGVRIKGGVTAI